MTFAATNLRDLERLIAEGLCNIVPSIDPRARWTETPATRSGGGGEHHRLFSLEWGDGEPVIGGATGNADYEWATDLDIVVLYGGLPENLLGEAIDRDHGDINRYFSDRLESIAGLMNWEPLGHVARDESAKVYEQRFRVSHMRV